MPTHAGSYPPTRYKAKPKLSRSALKWRPGIVTYICLVWFFLIFYQESYIFKEALRSCSFDSWTDPALPTDQKLALLGDPQLVDENTYARRGVALMLTKFYTDLYMRRNYRLLNAYFSLNTIIFTGDLFDGGREWSDKVWQREYDRFTSIFHTRSSTKIITSLPGNHDIGISDGIKNSVYHRFRQYFGETSQVLDSGAWEIVVLDTVALSSPDREVYKFPRTFLEEWSATRNSKPKLLVTHIPLYRETDASCGPLRESKNSIRIQRGHQYQNVLDPAISDEIWTKVKPSVIFAGDDHDYCDHQHDNGIHEINVKSFSWAMGIKRPGIQFVSLSGTRYETHLCLLPGQLPVFGRYGLLLAFTITILAIQATRRTSSSQGGLPRTNKDDAGKNSRHKSRTLQVLQRAARDLGMVAWPVLIYYALMIWW